MSKPDQSECKYMPSLDEVIRMAPRLNDWVKLAAWTFGTYKGINEAIKRAHAHRLSVPDHADSIRGQMALLSVIRAFASLDRESKVSIQSVHRFIKTENGYSDICRLASRNAAPSAPANFIGIYKEIDFGVLSRMQGFRNSLAHTTWSDIEKLITYDNLECLILLSCRLCFEINLMTRGLNGNPKEYLDIGEIEYLNFWMKVISSELDIV